MVRKLYFEKERRDMAVLIYFLYSRFHEQVSAKRNVRVYLLRDFLQDRHIRNIFSRLSHLS